MKAHKQAVTVREDHQLEIHLPEDFPPGPAEVIVLAGPSGARARTETQQEKLRVVKELRAFKPTPEEERVLDEFEEFRRRHPISFSSLSDEE
jgi:hypothetical protein